MATKPKVYAEVRRTKRTFGREKWYFVVRSAANGQVLATSERYVNSDDAATAAASMTPDVRDGA